MAMETGLPHLLEPLSWTDGHGKPACLVSLGVDPAGSFLSGRGVDGQIPDLLSELGDGLLEILQPFQCLALGADL